MASSADSESHTIQSSISFISGGTWSMSLAPIFFDPVHFVIIFAFFPVLGLLHHCVAKITA